MLPFVIVACTIFSAHEIPVNVTSFDLEIFRDFGKYFQGFMFLCHKKQGKNGKFLSLKSGQDLFPRITNKTVQTKNKDITLNNQDSVRLIPISAGERLSGCVRAGYVIIRARIWC